MARYQQILVTSISILAVVAALIIGMYVISRVDGTVCSLGPCQDFFYIENYNKTTDTCVVGVYYLRGENDTSRAMVGGCLNLISHLYSIDPDNKPWLNPSSKTEWYWNWFGVWSHPEAYRYFHEWYFNIERLEP